MNPDIEEEFEFLLMDQEEGTISQEGMERLKVLMKQHPSLRETYVKQQMLHAVSSKIQLETLSLKKLEQRKNIIPFVTWMSAAAAVLVCCFALLMNGNDIAEPIAFSNQPQKVYQVTRDGKRVKTDVFQLGDVIESQNEEMSIYYYGESTIVILKKNSRVVLKDDRGAKQIYLQEGSVICDVDKQPQNKPMVIFTNHAKTTVLGTQFLLSSEPDQTKLQVSEGLVHFEDVHSSKNIEAAAGYKAKTGHEHGIELSQTIYPENVVIDQLVLMDPISETPHFESKLLLDGMVIDRKKMKSDYINILMDANNEQVGGVVFRFDIKDLEGKKVVVINEKDQQKNRGQESLRPFYVIGDGLGDREDKPCKWKVVPGKYKLTLTPYGDRRAALGKPITVNFQVK